MRLEAHETGILVKVQQTVADEGIAGELLPGPVQEEGGDVREVIGHAAVRQAGQDEARHGAVAAADFEDAEIAPGGRCQPGHQIRRQLVAGAEDLLVEAGHFSGRVEFRRMHVFPEDGGELAHGAGQQGHLLRAVAQLPGPVGAEGQAGLPVRSRAATLPHAVPVPVREAQAVQGLHGPRQPAPVAGADAAVVQEGLRVTVAAPEKAELF